MELSKCVNKNIARIGSLKVKPAAKSCEKSALKYLCTEKKKRMIQTLSDNTWFGKVKVQYMIVTVLCFYALYIFSTFEIISQKEK